MSLNSKATRYLRGLAHHLKPVVQIGNNGPSAEVIHATREALEHHELIKCKVDGDRDNVREAADSLVTGTHAALVQIIGKTVVLYKARKEDPDITLPK